MLNNLAITLDQDTVLSGKISGSISKSDLEEITNNRVILEMIISDGAGNQRIEKQVYGIDNQPPAVNFSNPQDSAIVNGQIQINGTASDNVELKQVDLYRLASAEESSDVTIVINNQEEAKPVILLQSFTDQDKYNWVYKKNDVELIDISGYDGKVLTFVAVATDKADNKTIVTRIVTVDQDSDRPIVRFSNVNFTSSMTQVNPIWITKEQIYGTVYDDDGTIQSAKIAFTSSPSTLPANGDWQEIYDAEQANWVYNFPTDAEHSKDGFNVIWFKVVDAKNTTFVSSVSNAKDLSAPKLGSRDVTFGSEEKLYSTVLYAKVDLKAPTIPIASYSTDTKYENYTSEQLAAIFDGEHIKAQYSVDWKELSTLSEKIGGDTKALYVLVLGKDSNGIQELSCLFGDSSDNITSGPENAGCIVTDANGNKAQLFKVNLGANDYANKEGKYNLSVKAIDNAGAQSSLHFEVF